MGNALRHTHGPIARREDVNGACFRPYVHPKAPFLLVHICASGAAIDASHSKSDGQQKP